MIALQLWVPEHGLRPEFEVNLRPRGVAQWLSGLPLSNGHQAGAQLHQVLHRGNRSALEPEIRHQALELIRPAVQKVTDALKNEYIGAAFPLTERGAGIAALIQRLLTELAVGYKIVIVDRLALQTGPAAGAHAVVRDGLDPVLLDALYRATTLLSRVLVESYLVYAPEPREVWSELHALYRYAENQLLHVLPVPQGSPGPGTEEITLADAYKQIVLLALGNPYQLMQGEADVVYYAMAEWAQQVKLARLGPSTGVAGKFIIDLLSDSPPRYQTSDRQEERPAEARVVDVSLLLETLSTRIEAHDRTKGRFAKRPPRLAERMELDMYARLKRSWGARFDRLSARSPGPAGVSMVAGLSACHVFIGEQRRFTPEQDEIELRKRGDSLAGKSLQFTLAPEDEEPWTQQEREARLKAGIDRPRTSEFDTDNDDEKDIWIKVYATPATLESSDQRHPVRSEPHYVVSEWQQRNESLGGMCVYCVADCRTRVRVGELVGYRRDPAGEQDSWHIGVIRWLRSWDDTSVELGIMALAEDAFAVATRAVEGIGKGGEYFRGLLVPRLNPLENPTTLITPAAIYDVGTVLVLNMTEQLLYVKLVRIVESTKSFTQFRFEIAHRVGKGGAPEARDKARKERIFR